MPTARVVPPSLASPVQINFVRSEFAVWPAHLPKRELKAMPNETTEPTTPAAQNQLWRPVQVIVMSAVCLVVGVAVGYLLRGSAPTAGASAPAVEAASAPSGMPGASGSQPMPALDDLKRVGDKKAEPLLTQLKTDPNNPDTLNHLGMIYESAHQFKEAEGYFQKSLQANPKNADVRTDLASCLYYTGNADGAIAELQKALTYDPKHSGALMNLGIIEYKAKNDVKGAVAAWEKLLKTNPDFDQKELVQHMIGQAKRAKDNPNPMGITKG
jgi:cytochrome c-type biogenesis protein CcmH/NrfG